MNDTRNLYLDILKGIAIIGVISVHTAQLFPYEINETLRNVASLGQYGVQLFFVISGYLTFLSFEHCDSAKQFLVKKLTALIPICYVANILHLLMNLILGNNINPLDYVFPFLFLNGFTPHYINNAPAGWYIGTLCVFYYITPLLFKLVNNLKKAYIGFYISLLICFVITYVISFRHDIGWFFYFWLPRQLPVLFLGIILYFLQKEEDKYFLPLLGMIMLFFIFMGCQLDVVKSQLHIMYGIFYFLLLRLIPIQKYSGGASKIRKKYFRNICIPLYDCAHSS